MNRQEAEEILKSEDPNISPLRAIGFLQGSDYERKRAGKLVKAVESFLLLVKTARYADMTISANAFKIKELVNAYSEWKKGES